MSNPVQEIKTIGFIDKYGNWEIRTVNITLDPGNSFRPVWPVNLQWPDGINGTFYKESRSGKCLYKEI